MDGNLLILKPYNDNQHENENNMVFVEKVKNYSKLVEHIRNKFNKKSHTNISLMSNYGEDSIILKDDEDYQTFLKVFRDVKKEIKVHFRSTKKLKPTDDHKFPVQKTSELRFVDIEQLPEQSIPVVEVDDFDKKEIKNGKFLIAYCDKFKEIKEDVEKDVNYYEKIAKYLGFSENNIERMRNPRKNELFEYFDSCGDQNDVDCFIFAFSGHGHIEAENSCFFFVESFIKF